MDVKKDILWRVYLCFLGMALIGIVIAVKAFLIQDVEGDYWRNMANDLHDRYMTIDAERGTIYSADGRMLSTTIPSFTLYMDFRADGLVADDGKHFYENLDSLSYCLSKLFKDRSRAGYKQLLSRQYKKGSRFFQLKKEISFEQYKKLRDFPLFRLGRNSSGLIVKQVNKRVNPFGLLANRTVGLYRKNSPNIGLEAAYNEYLKGTDGKCLVQRISGGGYIPVDGYRIDPVNGKDVITTLDINIQDVAENALQKMLVENQAQYGTCIIMEVKTGQIKAMANLGRQPDGSYYEDFNYAIGKATEPGSVFKLGTMIALLEDHKVTLNDMVNLGNGTWRFGSRTMRDAAGEATGMVTVAHAFEQSSNVGMSKLAYKYYKNDPEDFVTHLKKLRLNEKTGIDLLGEAAPLVKSPKSKTWSSTSLPWTSIGYEVLETPLNILTLYNAVANDGKMMKPYLVSAIESYGKVVKKFEPTVLEEKICSEETLKDVQKLLNGVVKNEYGTGHRALKNPYFKISGKTGTALVANGKYGYSQHIYQATFVGFFPSDHPEYSCIVTIKNRPHARLIYGASVAAPVFKEVSHKLYAFSHKDAVPEEKQPQFDDKLQIKAGAVKDAQTVLATLNFPVQSPENLDAYVSAEVKDRQVDLKNQVEEKGKVPDVIGMGLKDALFLLEERGLQVKVQGKGKVVTQSLKPGQEVGNGGQIIIQLS